MTSPYFNVSDFGTIGDGASKDTIAIQEAIDACHKAGGGKVLLPAGQYLCGTLFLKSNVEFHLVAGARILGSPDEEDYNNNDIFPENWYAAAENVTGRHLIIAYCQDNISITGNGIIDGNSSAFFGPLPEGAIVTSRYRSHTLPVKDWRPGQMVFFCRCTKVAVRDVQLLNSTYWTMFLLGCTDVKIRGVRVENVLATPNGDGIDIDCCRNVTISDCIIRTSDDSLTLRANDFLLGDTPQPCENVVVTNCILRTACNAIRIGVGDGEIRNCLFNNIIIDECSRGISIVSHYSPFRHAEADDISHGICIENIHFTDFIMNADLPITVGVGQGARRPAAIRDISFQRFRITAWAAAQFVGEPEVPLEGIILKDCEWLVRGGTESLDLRNEMPAKVSHHGYKGRCGEPALPCAIYGADIESIVCDNIRLRWEDISPVWRDGIFFERVADAEFRHLILRQPQQDEGAAVHCRQSGRVSLTSCRTSNGTHTFLQTEASKAGAEIRCFGNDFGAAQQPFQTDINIIES